MSKSSASRLAPRVPHVPGTSRRAQYSASTKRALVDVAEELFTDNGYAATSLDAIVAGARVTKGALYHHFSGKQALFEAVFERVETDAARDDPAGAARATRTRGRRRGPGCARSSSVVQEPRYRRIVIQEGPSVLGYERYREQEERSTFANVLDIVRAVLSAGAWELDEDMLQTFAPDLLRRDVLGRRVGLGAPRTRSPPPCGSRRRSGSSWPASRRSPTPARELPAGVVEPPATS